MGQGGKKEKDSLYEEETSQNWPFCSRKTCKMKIALITALACSLGTGSARKSEFVELPWNKQVSSPLPHHYLETEDLPDHWDWVQMSLLYLLMLVFT